MILDVVETGVTNAVNGKVAVAVAKFVMVEADAIETPVEPVTIFVLVVTMSTRTPQVAAMGQ